MKRKFRFNPRPKRVKPKQPKPERVGPPVDPIYERLTRYLTYDELQARLSNAYHRYNLNPRPAPYHLEYNFTKIVKRYAIDHKIKLTCSHYQFFVYMKACAYFEEFREVVRRFGKIFRFAELPSLKGPTKYQKRYHFKDWDKYVFRYEEWER